MARDLQSRSVELCGLKHDEHAPYTLCPRRTRRPPRRRPLRRVHSPWSSWCRCPWASGGDQHLSASYHETFGVEHDVEGVPETARGGWDGQGTHRRERRGARRRVASFVWRRALNARNLCSSPSATTTAQRLRTATKRRGDEGTYDDLYTRKGEEARGNKGGRKFGGRGLAGGEKACGALARCAQRYRAACRSARIQSPPRTDQAEARSGCGADMPKTGMASGVSPVAL